MSGEAELLTGVVGAAVVGAVVIPVVVGGALLAGTAQAIKGTVSLARNIHKAHVRHRIDSAYSRAVGLLAQTADLQDEVHRQMAQASGAVYEKYINSVNSLNEAFGSEPDTSAFVENYESARRTFAEEFEKSLASIERQYISPIETAVNKTKAQLESERAETLASIENMREDIAGRTEKSRTAANEIIEKTKTVIEEFSKAHEGNAHAQDYAVTLGKALNAAVDRYNQGQYEAAIIDAYDAYSKCITTVEALLSEDNRVDFLYDRCIAAVTELEKHLESTQFADYEFSDTLDGEPIRYEKLDMAPYYCGAREDIQSRLEQLKAQLSAKDRYGFTPEELIDLITQADNLNVQYVKNTATAFERLYNHLERNQMADIIADAYIAMGFREVEPDEAPSFLDAIVVQMEHPDTEELVKIYLNVLVDEESHISTGIDILSHAESIDAATERRRNEQREQVCSSIMNSDFGKRKGIVATQKCKGGTLGKNAF